MEEVERIKSRMSKRRSKEGGTPDSYAKKPHFKNSEVEVLVEKVSAKQAVKFSGASSEYKIAQKDALVAKHTLINHLICKACFIVAPLSGLGTETNLDILDNSVLPALFGPALV